MSTVRIRSPAPRIKGLTGNRGPFVRLDAGLTLLLPGSLPRHPLPEDGRLHSKSCRMETCLEADDPVTLLEPPVNLMCCPRPVFRPRPGISCCSILLLLLSSVSLAAGSPRIELFTASESFVLPGTSVTLDWLVNDADSLCLNGLEISDTRSLAVSPLLTTTYSLTAANDEGTSNAEVEVIVLNAPRVIGAEGRFVEVIKNDLENTRLHLSEIEVFRIGVAPDEANQDGTSSNDLVQVLAATVVSPPTTVLLDHGDPAGVLDGDLES